jgi:hypothetical protein
LLALTTTASAGSVSETSSTAIVPPKHHSYVWRHGWHYGWYRSKNPQSAWYGDKYYAWNPVAAGTAVGLAVLPLALATGGLPYYNYPYYGYPYYYF